MLAEARVEADAVLARTREDANRFRDEMKQKAQAEAAGIVKNAERQIELETARALQQIRTEAVESVGGDRVEDPAAQRVEGRQRAADRGDLPPDRIDSAPVRVRQAMTTRRRHCSDRGGAASDSCCSPTPSTTSAGPNVLAGINRVGWGMAPILALAGLRFVLRAAAWRRCMPPHARFTLGQAFVAYLSGDAVGNVTPLGLLASEPTKVFLIRHRLATREAASSLALDFVVYRCSAVTMIVVGLVALLATVPLPLGVREIVAVVALAVIGRWRSVWLAADRAADNPNAASGRLARPAGRAARSRCSRFPRGTRRGCGACS